jgi:hypothetical protein
MWFNRFISWVRYLYWSELNRLRLDQYTEESNISVLPESWKWWAFMSQWYASLWVVVEGWKTLKIEDREIDYLISEHPQYCLLLKKFRHSVYHCSPTLLDERSLEFVRQGQVAVYWAAALHEEFKRYYWEWPEKVMVTREQISELKNSMYQLIGWFPTNIMPARKCDLKALCDGAKKMLGDANDFSSTAAIELLEAVKQARKIIKKSPNRIFLPEFMKLEEKSTRSSD